MAAATTSVRREAPVLMGCAAMVKWSNSFGDFPFILEEEKIFYIYDVIVN